MDGKQISVKRIKQPVSVPFLWEEKPGTPKKDWKPTFTPLNNPIAPPTPLKLIASVPFEWEEKPGKPLPFFSQTQTDVADFSSYSRDDDHRNDNFNDDGDDEHEYMNEAELDAAWGFEMEESFSSAPSLLANRLVSTLALSEAEPVNQVYKTTPASPASESDSSTSSYATGTTSLVGAPFLECMFPLLLPNSSFLEKVSRSEKGSSSSPRNLDRGGNCSIAIRKPLTLGELIMMSRRRSCQRKAVQMQEHNLSMEFMKRSDFGCGIFGNSNGIRELQGKLKRQLQLKLI